MSGPNDESKQEPKTLRDLFKPGMELKPFRPVAHTIPGLDLLIYVEKDCSMTTRHLPGSNISLLIENHVEGEERIVGVQIAGFSQVANFTIAEKRPLAALTTKELERAFESATRKAAEDAWAAGLSVCGLVEGRRALVHPDKSVTFLE